jgi:selenide, water dikinase
MQSKNIILVGGGHAHALVLAHLQKMHTGNIHFIVVEPSDHVPYTGMLPGFVAGHYTYSDLHINIQKLCSNTDNTSYIPDRVIAVDTQARIITLSSGKELSYDTISFDIGIHSKNPHIQGLSDYAIPVKPLGAFAKNWKSFLAESNASSNIVIIGGGIAGVEMAFAISYGLRKRKAHVTIIDRNKILSETNSNTQHFLRKELVKQNITVFESTVITKVASKKIFLDNNQELSADFILAATGARPYTWLEQTGIDLTDGFITVNKHLQNTRYPNVFAAGDCAHFNPQPLQKAGVYAVRQAPILANNIMRFTQNTSLQSFNPQSHYLKLVSLGEKRACASKYNLCIHGKALWNLKNHIDRKFISQFK